MEKSQNLKLAPYPGSHFLKVAEDAKQIASRKGFDAPAVEYDFNGIICLVTSQTDTELLFRDYKNADATFGPHVIGPSLSGVP